MTPPHTKVVTLPAPDIPPFRIRRARRGDSEALAALLRELGYPEGTDTQTVHWVVSHPEIEVFVAGDPHDKPVGMVSLSHRPQLRFKGRIATLDELVVTESWRRRGVGRALLRHAIERAKVLSVKRLELAVLRARDEDLRRFCESCGFTEADWLLYRHQDTGARR